MIVADDVQSQIGKRRRGSILSLCNSHGIIECGKERYAVNLSDFGDAGRTVLRQGTRVEFTVDVDPHCPQHLRAVDAITLNEDR
jgi:hypothetical protein